MTYGLPLLICLAIAVSAYELWSGAIALAGAVAGLTVGALFHAGRE